MFRNLTDVMRDVYDSLPRYARGSSNYLSVDELLPTQIVEAAAGSDTKWEMAAICILGPTEQLLSESLSITQDRYRSLVPDTTSIREYAQSNFPTVGGARPAMWELARSAIANPANPPLTEFPSAQRRRSTLAVLVQAVEAVISLRLLNGTLKVPSENPYNSASYRDQSNALVLNEDEMAEHRDLWEQAMYRWADGFDDELSVAAVIGVPAAEGAVATTQQFYIAFQLISGAARNILADRWPNTNVAVDTQDVEDEIGIQRDAHPASWEFAVRYVVLGPERLDFQIFSTPRQRAAALYILLAVSRHAINYMRAQYGPSTL
ncbi:hypothetical protein MSTE_00754 [Mycobacteroides stephanolepidis]|uniref:Uncharacterized protein n=2 Tax=[Mycobacterium] stephanolepidis TaxID=1520670 RepID=A0A1Z4ET03_9MYCO|nr:hypothetical protein MSTE_00754 [[Mycobacterium] stephanolepidis]